MAYREAANGIARPAATPPLRSAAMAGLQHGEPFGERHPSREEAERALADDGIIVVIVERFDSLIGLWTDDSEAQ
jgi:hypothetical protein